MPNPGVPAGGGVREDEIEAVARALCDKTGFGPHYGGEHRTMAETAIAALDRVRAERAESEGVTVYDCAHSNARYAQPCDRCPAETWRPGESSWVPPMGHAQDCGLLGDAECTCHKREESRRSRINEEPAMTEFGNNGP